MQQDEFEQVIASTKYFEGLIAEWEGDLQNALKCYRKFKFGIKNRCDHNGIDFNEIWGILCSKHVDYADFELPTDELPIGSNVENKIKALSVANCAA